MKKLDDQLIYAYQYTYEYLLDRWVIPIGFIRQTALIILIYGIVWEVGYDSWWVMVAVPIASISFIVHELEIRAQQRGRFELINKLALDQRTEPPKVILRMFVKYFLILHYSLTALVLREFGGTIVLLGWFLHAYALCVMVREPDEDRFKEPDLVPQEAGA